MGVFRRRRGGSGPPGEEIAAINSQSEPTAATSALVAAIGPMYDVDGVRALLGGISPETLAGLLQEGAILGLTTSDGVVRFPVSQFVGPHVDPALVPLFHAMREVPRWSLASWLSLINDDLDGTTPLTWLRTGRDPDQALASARRTAVEWR